MQLTITLNDNEYAALAAVTADPAEWVRNLVLARGDAAVAELKQHPDWNRAVVALAQAGGDLADDKSVLAKGKAVGLFAPVPEPGPLKG